MARTLGKFDIPIPPFDPATETEVARRTRRAAVKALVLKIFKLSKIHLGEEDARKLFIDVTHRKRGKRPAEELNEKLLYLYDLQAAKDPQRADSAPRRIAEQQHALCPKQFGLSPKAIEKKIRRLLAARRKRAAEALRLRELFKTAEGEYPGMLSRDDEGH